jgi:hypothetical protein
MQSRLAGPIVQTCFVLARFIAPDCISAATPVRRRSNPLPSDYRSSPGSPWVDRPELIHRALKNARRDGMQIGRFEPTGG